MAPGDARPGAVALEDDVDPDFPGVGVGVGVGGKLPGGLEAELLAHLPEARPLRRVLHSMLGAVVIACDHADIVVGFGGLERLFRAELGLGRVGQWHTPRAPRDQDGRHGETTAEGEPLGNTAMSLHEKSPFLWARVRIHRLFQRYAYYSIINLI